MKIFDKVYFIHIPKTAGSSLNKIFGRITEEGRVSDHIESNFGKFKEIIESEGPFFLSGHVTFEASYDIIRRDDVFAFTVVREPTTQLLSHLNWVKYVGSPSFPDPGAIPEPIMDFARLLYETPLSDIDKTAEIVDTQMGRNLFDNIQTRYMTDARMDLVEDSHAEAAIRNVKDLNLAFPLEKMDIGLSAIKKYVKNVDEMEVLNEARIKDEFDIDSDKTKLFIEQWTSYDRRLYEEVCDTFSLLEN